MQRVIYSHQKHFDAIVGFLFSYVGGHIALAAFDGRDLRNLMGTLPCVFQGNSRASNVEIRVQHTPIIHKLMKNSWPTEIRMELVDLGNATPVGNPPYTVNITKNVSAWQIQAAFVLFYESILTDIQNKFEKDVTKWPAIFNFGRAIRNACAHNGRIHFTNDNSSAVSWKNISYSPADNGKPIIFQELATADIIVLMDEMESQL